MIRIEINGEQSELYNKCYNLPITNYLYIDNSYNKSHINTEAARPISSIYMQKRLTGLNRMTINFSENNEVDAQMTLLLLLLLSLLLLLLLLSYILL